MIITGVGKMNIVYANNFSLDTLNERQRILSNFLLKFFGDIKSNHNGCTVTLLGASKNREFRISLAPADKSSYEMVIIVSNLSILLELDGWHEHFYFDKIDLFDCFLAELNNFLIFVLSNMCKMLTYQSNGKDYKWTLVSSDGKVMSSVGIIIYNYFGKKSIVEKKVVLFSDANVSDASVFLQKYV